MLNLVNQDQSKLLTDEIKEAEWQVLNRQQVIDSRTTILVRTIYREMTDPASLLLASGVGFVVSELTKRRPSVKVHGPIDKARITEVSPLKVALNLLTSARTLYTALPIAWIMKSRYRPRVPAQASRQRAHPVPAPGSMQNRRRYNRRKPLS